jgi:hypothetical protein
MLDFPTGVASLSRISNYCVLFVAALDGADRIVMSSSTLDGSDGVVVVLIGPRWG